MKKNVNGVDVDLTPDEILVEQKKETDWIAEKQKEVTEKYKFNRLAEYPSVQDQLLLLWDAMDKGEIPQAKSFYEAIKTINDKYPAPV
jgi:hypothetical protein